jgi:hypothetical protein
MPAAYLRNREIVIPTIAQQNTENARASPKPRTLLQFTCRFDQVLFGSHPASCGNDVIVPHQRTFGEALQASIGCANFRFAVSFMTFLDVRTSYRVLRQSSSFWQTLIAVCLLNPHFGLSGDGSGCNPFRTYEVHVGRMMCPVMLLLTAAARPSAMMAWDGK